MSLWDNNETQLARLYLDGASKDVKDFKRHVAEGGIYRTAAIANLRRFMREDQISGQPLSREVATAALDEWLERNP